LKNRKCTPDNFGGGVNKIKKGNYSLGEKKGVATFNIFENCFHSLIFKSNSNLTQKLRIIKWLFKSLICKSLNTSQNKNSKKDKFFVRKSLNNKKKRSTFAP
jgi:hypothetical protein